MARLQSRVSVAVPTSTPQFELRLRHHGPGDDEYEIWQMPAPATPQIATAVRIAGLRGRNLELIEHCILKRLSHAGIKLHETLESKNCDYKLTEDAALMLGLLFRCLAPMRKRENIRAVTDGVEAMEREEAAYWLGMAIHRKKPRRVLMALRLLLTDKKQSVDSQSVDSSCHG